MPPPDILTLPVGQMSANCYIVYDKSSLEGLIIDPGDDPEYISGMLEKHRIRPTAMLGTHGHFDHLMAAFALQKFYSLPFFLHTDDEFLVRLMQKSARHFLGVSEVDPPPTVTDWLADGQRLTVGSQYDFRVVHAPGHTPGSVYLYEPARSLAFVGDTLFSGGGVGRTDHAYSDPDKLRQSVATALSYPETTSIFSGHGEPTTVRAERRFHGV